jgi:hypothetical protein
MRALSRDPGAFVPGYNPVPAAVDEAVAREALATLPTVVQV